jgi:predicted small lipoprotein YifL
MVLLGTAVLALGGCGRKGPLDLPPNAASAQTPAQVTPTDTAAQQASQPSVFNSTYGADAPQATPRGVKKPFVLDPLLNSN